MLTGCSNNVVSLLFICLHNPQQIRSFFFVCIPHTKCTVARLQATSRPFTIKLPVFGSASQLTYHPGTHTMTASHTLYLCRCRCITSQIVHFCSKKGSRRKVLCYFIVFLPRCCIMPSFQLYHLLPVEKHEIENELAVGRSLSLHHRELCLHL